MDDNKTILRDDNILEYNLVNRTLQINLDSAYIITLLKHPEGDAFTIIINGEKQMNNIPIDQYNRTAQLLRNSRLYELNESNCKMKNYVIKQFSINKPQDQLIREDFEEVIDTVEIFVNIKSSEILSICYFTDDEKNSRILVDVKNKGTIVLTRG